MASVVFGTYMVVLDLTVINVVLPTLAREFRAQTNEVQWVISLYALALGVATPLAGYAADRFGIKRVFLLSLVGFALGSFVCGVSPSLGALVAGRALQGLSGGAIAPLGTAMLLGAFPREERGFAYGVYGVALVLAPASGPLLGGLFVDLGLWRWIFFVNVPISLAGVAVGAALLRERRAERRPHLDAAGLVLSAVGFGGLLYGASVAGEAGWASPPAVAALSLGALLLAAWVVVELRAEQPLLDLSAFRIATFRTATLAAWVGSAALVGAEFLMPLYLQTVRGYGALETGLLVLPLALTFGAVSPLGGRLFDRFGPRLPLAAGFALLAINMLLLSRLLGPATPTWAVLGLMALRGAAFGLTIQLLGATAFGQIRDSQLPRASSLFDATAQSVQAVAVAALATTVAASAAHSAAPNPPAAFLEGITRAYTVGLVAALVALALALSLPTASNKPPEGREPK
jgi:DHA2 family multidrug resistance protein